MNRPKLLEGAIAAVIHTCAPLAELPRLRTWQAVDADQRWTPVDDLVYPMVDIRCAPGRTDDNGCTQAFAMTIEIVTSVKDDITHAQLAVTYEAVEMCFDALYADYLNNGAGTNYPDDIEAGRAKEVFEQHLTDQGVSALRLSVQGIEYGEPEAPFDDDGKNVIGLSLMIQTSRRDFNT